MPPQEMLGDTEQSEYQLMPTYTISILRSTPRARPEESEDRAKVLDNGKVIHLLVADGATGLGSVCIEGKAPGWFAAEHVQQIFRSQADSLTPLRDVLLLANRTLRETLAQHVASGHITTQDMVELCSAVCVMARVRKQARTLEFAATKSDCWLLVVRANDTAVWLTSDPPTDMDYGPIKAAVDLRRSGIIPQEKGSLNHPAVARAVRRGRRDANLPSGLGNGRINGAPEQDVSLYLEDNAAHPFRLQPGDRVYLGTDGLLPLMSRSIYDEPDPHTGARMGRREQRRFVEDILRTGDTAALHRAILERETADPEAIRFPHIKEKTGDDKALIELRVELPQAPETFVDPTTRRMVENLWERAEQQSQLREPQMDAPTPPGSPQCLGPVTR